MSNLTTTVGPREILKIFTKQAATLINRGYDRLAGDNAGQFFQSLNRLTAGINKIDPIIINEGYTPCVLVVSRRCVQIARQAESVIIDGKRGICAVEDTHNLPSLNGQRNLYIIFNITLGINFKDVKRAEDVREALGVRFRRGLTAEEGIAMATHFPKSLEEWPLRLVGGDMTDEDEKHTHRQFSVSAYPWPILFQRGTGAKLDFGDTRRFRGFAFPSCDDEKQYGSVGE